MSGYTPVGSELLYSCSQASTAVTTPTTTPGASMIPGLPPIAVPAGYMANAGGHRASSLKLEIWGLAVATATVPTWGFSLWATSAVPPVWAATLSMVTASSTITPTAGTAPFYARWDIQLRTEGAIGANSTLITHGTIECPLWPTAAAAGLLAGKLWMPPAGTLGNPTTWETDLQYFLWPTIFCGAATALNYVTTEIVKLTGEN